MPNPVFSFILPFYKQSDQLTAVLAEFESRLNGQPQSFELIAVINGIEDQAEPMITNVIQESPRVIKISLRGSGWGMAVRAGMADAKGEYVCYTNTARTKVDELIKMLPYALISKNTVIKATRTKRSNWVRKWTSILFNLENRFILGTPAWDVNATPKIVPRGILQFLKIEENGDLIDAELLYGCFLQSISIIEIPIQHIERRSGKSTTGFKSAIKMFTGIIRIKRERHGKKNQSKIKEDIAGSSS